MKTAIAILALTASMLGASMSAGAYQLNIHNCDQVQRGAWASCQVDKWESQSDG